MLVIEDSKWFTSTTTPSWSYEDKNLEESGKYFQHNTLILACLLCWRFLPPDNQANLGATNQRLEAVAVCLWSFLAPGQQLPSPKEVTLILYCYWVGILCYVIKSLK